MAWHGWLVVGEEPGNQRCCANATSSKAKMKDLNNITAKREYEGYEDYSQYEQDSFIAAAVVLKNNHIHYFQSESSPRTGIY